MAKYKFLMRLAAYGLAVFFLFSACLSWLGFASGAGDIGKHFRRIISSTTGFCSTCKLNEIDPQLPFVKALSSDKVEESLAQKATALGSANHVQILLTGSEFEYTIYAGGERLVLFKTPATEEGLNQAQPLLDKLVEDKIKQPAVKHHAAFSQNNESVEKQKILVAGKTATSEHLVLARRPYLTELYGIEAALARSVPSNHGPGESGLKFYFLLEQLTAGSKDAAAYFVYKDKDDRAAIYITPDALDKLWVTEADAPPWAVRQRTSASGVYYDTMESLMVHELAHNHQSRLGWDDSDQVKLLAMAERSGFVVIKEDGANIFLIKVKVTSAVLDQPVASTIELYRLEGGVDHTGGKRWFRVGSSGQWLDENGLTVTSSLAAKTLTNDQVKANAAVTPATAYFDTPFEVEAEAIKLYRLGGDSRRKLLLEAPVLYQLAKDEDQKEIDLYFGYVQVREIRLLNKQNQNSPLPDIERIEPVLIRSFNGTLVPYTSESFGEIKRQEILAATKP